MTSPTPTPAPSAPPGAATKAGDAATRVKDLLSFQGKYRILHLTWFAFFLSFVVWFNFAPFANTIAEDLGLTGAQKKTIGLCNVALTVPARIFIGMALDRWGPRRVYSTILVFAVVPNTIFAFANSFEAMVFSRLGLSIVGAGFVVGIRMVSEWFPPREVGTAEGVYGGWGNFGSAAAAFSLPILAGAIASVSGNDSDGWRWAIFTTGVVAAVYGLVYLRSVTDTPEGVSYAKPRRQGALEVTSRKSVFGLALLTVPFTAILGVIAWRVWREDVISDTAFIATLVAIAALLLFQEYTVFKVNKPALANSYPVEDQYPVRNVAVLCVAYFATFGSELAVVTMLPGFFADTWGLGPAVAGAAASGFAFMNLVARPAGGLLSDIFGSRKRTLRTLLVGLLVGYGLMSTLGSAWPWVAAIAVCMCCSFFVQSGEGAVYAIVPLVKKRVSGQVAGMAGAMGNVGAVCFLTINILVSTQVFFLCIGAAALVALFCSRYLIEPENSFGHELLTDAPHGADVDLVDVAESPTLEAAPVDEPTLVD